jgi:hypothetical protein
MLLQTMHNVIGNPVTFLLGQPSRSPRTSLRALISANAIAKLSRSPRVRIFLMRTDGERLSSVHAKDAEGTKHIRQMFICSGARRPW